MSKSILSLFVAVILVVVFIAVSAIAGGQRPVTFDNHFQADMIDFGGTFACGEVKIQNNNKIMKVENFSCLSASTQYRVCIYWAEGASTFSASLGTPTTDTGGEFTFTRDLDDGSVANLDTTDALEDLVVQVRSGSTTCSNGTIELASGIAI